MNLRHLSSEAQKEIISFQIDIKKENKNLPKPRLEKVVERIIREWKELKKKI